jgi:hypothetical protein
MADKAEELRAELTRIIDEHARKYPNLPTAFPPELIRRVVEYAREQGAQGKPLSQCSAELGLAKARLLYWLYHRSKKIPRPPQPPAMRPVRVTAQQVHVCDGVPEKRYTFTSPAGWQVRELTLAELVELLRGLT